MMGDEATEQKGHKAVNLSSLDLNLLVSLQALIEERSVTRAASRLHLSQPALSAALSKLREHFGDDLLLRVGNQYVLSPFATDLKDRVAAALASIYRVFATSPDFEAAGSDREFTLLCSDYATAVLGPTVLRLLDQAAPRARLRMLSHTTDIIDHASERLRAVDGLLLPRGFVTDLPSLDLYHDQWVCIVAEDNAAVKDGLTIADLSRMPWVVTFHSPTSFTPPARQMRMLGVEPKIQIVTENFNSVPFLVANSNRIALMQETLARRLQCCAGVRMLKCPFDAVPLVQTLWWDPIHDRDPGHVWFRNLLAQAGRFVDAGHGAG